MLAMVGSASAEEGPTPVARADSQGAGQAIVQIGGRHCEYHREDVEGALRRFDAVRQVEFLNNHGTVLVQFERGIVPPEQLAQAVERALVMGWGCKAWIE
jgi:copper chaperone CopZ